MNVDDLNKMLNIILKDEEEDIIINVPLKDLIWTMIIYSYEMRDIEDKIFSNYPFIPDNLTEDNIEYLSRNKEYLACRRDELAKIISHFSDFDTSKIWEQVNLIFKKYY